MPGPTQLIHVRVPIELHAELKATASSAGLSLQNIAERRLRTNSVDTDSLGLQATYSSRYSDNFHLELASHIKEAQHIRLYGVTLLDFLTGDGWGAEVLSVAPTSATLQILLQDPQSRQTELKINSQIHEEQQYNVTRKYLDLAHGVETASALASRRRHTEVKLCTFYPILRWMVMTESAVYFEPHCPRIYRDQEFVGENLPIFKFAVKSSVWLRYLEHFNSIWEHHSRERHS